MARTHAWSKFGLYTYHLLLITAYVGYLLRLNTTYGGPREDWPRFVRPVRFSRQTLLNWLLKYGLGKQESGKDVILKPRGF